MRLIDTDKLKKDILLQNILGEPIQKIIDRYIHIVDEQPTAFDVDKVVEMLEEECFSPIDYPGYAVDIEKAIEIVEEGGVDGKERI